MINLALLRDDPGHFKTLIKKKDPSFDVDRLITLDVKLRAIRNEVELLRQKKMSSLIRGNLVLPRNSGNNRFALAK